MDPTRVTELMAKLGIKGLDPTKASAVMDLAKELGEGTEVSPEELEAYYPDVDVRSFYLPTNLPKNFYYDAEGLKKLSRVNSNVFRRLLGIE